MKYAWWKRRKSQGSVPTAFVPVTLYPNPNAQYFYQEKQTYNWPSVPAHEQLSALTNAWEGNQLPGPTNFIPGVQSSYILWNIPTSYMNTMKNVQFNKGYNIMNSTPTQQSDILKQAIANWQGRVSY
jgi:hypothetical protein